MRDMGVEEAERQAAGKDPRRDRWDDVEGAQEDDAEDYGEIIDRLPEPDSFVDITRARRGADSNDDGSKWPRPG